MLCNLRHRANERNPYLQVTKKRETEKDVGEEDGGEGEGEGEGVVVEVVGEGVVVVEGEVVVVLSAMVL